ncbi:MAG: hypothetical protein ACXWLH_05155 [Candidatus Saccharimonadales bacterium]
MSIIGNGFEKGACVDDLSLRREWEKSGYEKRLPFIKPMSGVALKGVEIALSYPAMDFDPYEFSNIKTMESLNMYNATHSIFLFMADTIQMARSRRGIDFSEPGYEDLVNKVCDTSNEFVAKFTQNDLIRVPVLKELVNYLGVLYRVEDCFQEPKSS